MIRPAAGLAFAILAASPALAAECVAEAVPKPGHPSLAALPDSHFRAMPDWADLPPEERDLLARVSIVQRNLRTQSGRAVFSAEVPKDLVAIKGAPGETFVAKGAPQLEAMLAAARAALAVADPAGEVKISDSFRSYAVQRDTWPVNLRMYFERNRTSLAAYLVEGRYTDDAVCKLRAYISARYAFPGYSRHQSGKAVDFHTRIGATGLWLRTSTARDPADASGKSAIELWCDSPFFRWMRVHARDYGFVQAPIDEPWHWEWDPAAASNPAKANVIAKTCQAMEAAAPRPPAAQGQPPG